MSNPFDDPDASYTVLVNAEGQHCLWMASLETPGGWDLVHGPAARQSCLDYIKDSWTDMRPRSVAKWMDQAAA